MSDKLVCVETTSLNFSVNFWLTTGPANVVLFVKKVTETVFASIGIVAPLSEYLTLQLNKNVTAVNKISIEAIFFNKNFFCEFNKSSRYSIAGLILITLKLSGLKYFLQMSVNCSALIVL